jgi:DNA-binding beta-propeller fold protein YncE
MKTLSTTNSINRSPLRCGLLFIPLLFAFLAMPGTVRGQVQGGDLFATVNLGGTLTNVASPIYQYGSQYVPPGGTPGLFASALTPRGLAFDPVSGNLYVATNFNVDVSVDPAVVIGTIFKITPDGFMSTFATGFPVGFLQGLATDSAGNVFITAQDDAVTNAATTIYKITPDGTLSPFASLSFTGWALAFDSAGNLYVATGDATNGEILEFTPDYDPLLRTGMMTTFVGPSNFPPGGPGPIGLAFDASGNLFVSTVNGNDSTGDIRKFGPDGTEITPRFAMGLTNSPRGIAFDGAGNLFVAEIGTPPTDISPSITGDILQFTPGGTESVFSSQGFGTRWNRGPEWLAFTTRAVTPPSWLLPLRSRMARPL